MAEKRKTNLLNSWKVEHPSIPTQGLIVPAAFVRGIRHLGYRSSLEALAELVDNSIQAYAEQIELAFGFENGSVSKPSYVAVIDDGHGMSPAAMRYALMWGGTHREDDRSGLGRFGYGLPCATASMGRRFTIYSKTRKAPLHSLTFDLDLLDRGAYTDEAGGVSLPVASRADLPSFLEKAIQTRFRNWQAGTIVCIGGLDRLDWTTAAGLRRNALRRFAVVYHKLLQNTAIFVDGEKVAPVDPLFLTAEAHLHAIDEDRAQALEPVTLQCRDSATGRTGTVVLRYSWLPPTFAAKDKARDAIGINANERFEIMKQYHGIVFSRNGRVVDVHSRTPWTTLINNDRYIRIEVEFSAALDEAFGVTTSKQQVSVSPQMWDQLQAAGLAKAIEQLRSKVRSAKARRAVAGEDGITAASQVSIHDTKLSPKQAVTASDRPGIALCAARALLRRSDSSEALELLLKEIEGRFGLAPPVVAREYAALLRLWSQRLRILGAYGGDRAR